MSSSETLDGISDQVVQEKKGKLLPPSELPLEDKLRQYLPDYGKFSWLRKGFLLRLNFLMFIVALSSTNTGYDASLLNSLQTFPDWSEYMGDPQGSKLGALSNGVVFGVFFSFVCASYISDKYGRRLAITIGNFIMAIGVIVQSAAQGYGMFISGRIIIGIGNGLAVVASPALVSELAYPTHRTVLSTIYNTCWYLGSIISAWVSFGTKDLTHTWSWRVPSIVQGFLPALQFLLIFLVPESPRWLIDKGRYDDARKVLMRFHAGNDEQVGGALVEFEMSEIQSAIELERIAAKSSYKDFFKSPGNRRRLFLVSFVAFLMQVSGNGPVSYYLNKVLESIGMHSQSEKLIVNGGLQIYNFGVSIIVATFVNLFTRRLMFLTSTVMMCVFYIIWTVLSAVNYERDFRDHRLGQGVLAMIFLYYFAYNMGYNGLPYLYVTEILPFTLRSKGINIFIMVQQAWQIFNGFVNPIAMDNIHWKFYIVFCCILFVDIFIIYVTFVETSGRTLEEVAEVFGESPDELSKDFTPSMKAEEEQVEDAASSEV